MKEEIRQSESRRRTLASRGARTKARRKPSQGTSLAQIGQKTPLWQGLEEAIEFLCNWLEDPAKTQAGREKEVAELLANVERLEGLIVELVVTFDLNDGIKYRFVARVHKEHEPVAREV